MQVTADINRISQEIAELYRYNITYDNAVATGALQKFTWTCRYAGGYYELIFTLPHYWKYAPETSRPSGAKMPPIDAIAEWIKVKRLPVPTSKKGVPQIRSMAYLIARGIQRKGYKNQPRTILATTLQEADERGLIQDLINAISDQLTIEIDAELKTISQI